MPPKSQRNVLATDPSPRCLERYRVLREVAEVGSVREVCQRAGITRQTFYLWRKRFAASGLSGLEDRPGKPSPGRPSSVNATIMSILIQDVRKDHQAGCLSLANHLTELGIRISPPAVQKYLNRWRLGSQQARARWIRNGCPQIELTGPLPGPEPPPRESYERVKSYYLFGIPKLDGEGIELLRPSLRDVALALGGVSLADIQVIADREHWIEIREKLLFQNQVKSLAMEEDQVRPSAAGDETANSKSSSWQSIFFRAIASMEVARRGLKPMQSEGGLGAEGSPEAREVTPSEDFKRPAAYWTLRWR